MAYAQPRYMPGYKACSNCGTLNQEGSSVCADPTCGTPDPAPPSPQRTPHMYPYGSPHPAADPYLPQTYASPNSYTSPRNPYPSPPHWPSPPVHVPPPSWGGSPYVSASPILPMYSGRPGDIYECGRCGGQYATRWCGPCGRDLSNDTRYAPNPNPPVPKWTAKPHEKKKAPPARAQRVPTPPDTWTQELPPEPPVASSPYRRKQSWDLAYGPMPPTSSYTASYTLSYPSPNRSGQWPPAPDPVVEIPASTAYYPSRPPSTFRGPGSTPRQGLKEPPQPTPPPTRARPSRPSVPVPPPTPTVEITPPSPEIARGRSLRRPETSQTFEDALAGGYEEPVSATSWVSGPAAVPIPPVSAIAEPDEVPTPSVKRSKTTFERIRSAIRGKSPERPTRPKSPVRFAATRRAYPEDLESAGRRSQRGQRRGRYGRSSLPGPAPVVEEDDEWEDTGAGEVVEEDGEEEEDAAFEEVDEFGQDPSDDWTFANPTFDKPVVPLRRLRVPFDDILDGDDTHKDHPAGKEAMVHPSGGPTPKLIHFVEALYTWICAKQPDDTPYITRKRLKFLEGTVGNSGITQIYTDDMLEQVYQTFGCEYAKGKDGLMLTFKGFLRYVDMWILCEPRFVCLQLKALVRHVGFPPPMKEWQGYEWLFDTSMTIHTSHPDAERWRKDAHQRMMANNKVVDGRGNAPLWAVV